MVAKIDDEFYVLSIIKIYSYFLFVFSVLLKKGQNVENIESDVATLNTLREEEFVDKIVDKIVDKKRINLDRIVDKIVDKKRINFLVSLYCSLLFSRKDIVKLSEVALVSVYCNCLIG